MERRSHRSLHLYDVSALTHGSPSTEAAVCAPQSAKVCSLFSVLQMER